MRRDYLLPFQLLDIGLLTQTDKALDLIIDETHLGLELRVQNCAFRKVEIASVAYDFKVQDLLQFCFVAHELFDPLPQIVWLEVLLKRVQSLHVKAPQCLLNLSCNSENIGGLLVLALRRKMIKLLV